MENPTESGASIHERLEALIAEEDVTTTQPDEEQAEEAEEPTEAEDSEEIAAAEDQPDDVPEGDEPSIELSHIAQYLGVEEDLLDVDEDGQVQFKTKIDGQEDKAKLKDFLANYQIRGHLDNQNREVAEIKKTLQSQLDQATEQASQRLENLENMANLAYSELVSEYQSVNWDELRQDDPAEFAAKQTEYNQRNYRIQQINEQAAQEKQRLDNERLTSYQAIIQEEQQKLREAIPEWSDESVERKEKAELTDYLKGIGYSSDEINQLSDHRMFLLLRKSMQFDNLQKNKAVVTKKVLKAPKLVKPGNPKSKQEQSEHTLSTIKQNIKKTGGKDKKSIVDYLIATGKV